MRLIHSEAITNLFAFKKLPSSTYRGLFVRFSGTNQAGKAVTRADLGRVRWNRNGTDEVNVTVDELLYYNDLKRAVAEFNSTVGGVFSASFYVPRHLAFDLFGGEFISPDSTYVQFDFPNIGTAAASGTVEISAVEGYSPAQYVHKLIQRNVQAGGAGTTPQEVEMKNISSLYVVENANISRVQVTADNREEINNSQAVLKAYSNNTNNVETAIPFYELRLNKFNQISPGLNSEIKIQFDVTAAVNIDMFVESIEYDGRMTGDSIKQPPPRPVEAE
jgi:hypothetical protein